MTTGRDWALVDEMLRLGKEAGVEVMHTAVGSDILIDEKDMSRESFETVEEVISYLKGRVKVSHTEYGRRNKA